MKILIISPGKNHDHTVLDGVEEYQTRLEKRFPVEWVFPTIGTKESEGAAIIKQIKEGDFVVLLDERGKDIDTPTFSKLIDRQMQSGTKRIVFVVGGAFGVSTEVKEHAQISLKLSSLVFPHMLARLILIEQLYRAVSIIDGSKYHHV